MKIYTYSEARQQLAELLSCARREGQVEIRRRDGQSFLVQPAPPRGSPLDVPAVESGLSRAAIVELVRDSRKSTERLPPSSRHRGGKSKRVRAGKSSRH
jgi:hypothetical protein